MDYSRSRNTKRYQYEEVGGGGQGFEYQGRYKRHQSAHSPRGAPPHIPRAPKSSANEIAFRILCPEAQVGSIIGKGGSIVKSLRAETGARINIQDPVPGAEERVILISSYDDGRDTNYISPAQEALSKVHSRIFENSIEDLEGQSRNIKTRLVVSNSQVGCLLGKGGKIIEQMRQETKAQIRVLSRDQLPLCTLPSDEIVQMEMSLAHSLRFRFALALNQAYDEAPKFSMLLIAGDLSVVKKALSLISARLKLNNPRERNWEKDRDRDQECEWEQEHEREWERGCEQEWEHGQPSPSVSNAYSPDHCHPGDIFSSRGVSFSNHTRSDGHVMRWSRGSSGNRNQGNMLVPSGSGHLHSETVECHGLDYEDSISGEELVFRILCSNKKIGSVIGKGGLVIKGLQEEIGAKIKITDSVLGSDERIIIVSADDVLEDNLSPAQEALLHIQSQIVDLGPDKDAIVTTKLLVPSNHVGCLLGKGGSVIKEMRRETRANIKILTRENLPPCALESDEMVQIVGDIKAARQALVQVTSKLRNLVHEMGTPRDSFFALPNKNSRRRPEPISPDRSYSPFMGFQAGNHSLANSREAWASKENNGRGLSDYEETPTQGGSIGTGISTSVHVTKKSVEVVIPERTIAPLIGNGAKSISQISQISGAKVTLLEGRPGSNRVIEISGTVDQTHSAQSVLHALILNGQSSHGAYSD